MSPDATRSRRDGQCRLEGRLTDPDIQLWPAVFGVVRNAFVEGLTSGFTHLPPEKTDDEQGVLTQAKDALKKDDGPPKAQPAKPAPGPKAPPAAARKAAPPKGPS